MPTPAIQAIIDEYRFRIVRKIADGGMGCVYEAIQDGANGFQKTVALKTILPDLADSGTFVDLFVQEAKLVANLVHENIVQIYQLGRTLDGYYMVLEYVHGLSLHEFIRTHRLLRRSVPVPLAAYIASRVARALQYAHSRTDPGGRPMHIVHRDVCPGNILITTEGLPKLTDFGIALVAGSVLSSKRRVLAGKAPYMAPEQARCEPADFRADLYSLGAVLFEMLAGERLRSDGTREEMIAQAAAGEVAWNHLPADLPPELRDILARCLAPDPADRYEATADLGRALEMFLYRDGYGPTTQTLESYLREHYAFLYQPRQRITLQRPRPDLGLPERQRIAKTILTESPS
jgi:serine/threonine protein kinase